MKKFLTICFFVFSLATAIQASTKEDGEPIPIRGIRQGGYIPHAPAIIPISCIVDSEALYIGVSFLYDLGDVEIDIRNLSTEEHLHLVSDCSLGGILIPFSASPGLWVISFILPSNMEYIGEFNI